MTWDKLRKHPRENSNDACIDACVWVRWLTEEEGTEDVAKLFSLWLEQYDFFILPSFFIFELSSALRKKSKLGESLQKKYDEVLDILFHLPILIYQSQDVMKESWIWSEKLGDPVVYDSSYLAVASLHQAPLFTCDARFYEKAKPLYPDIHLI